MKILVLNYEFPPLGGGAGNATYYLFREFSEFEDLEIDLVTSSTDKFKVEKFAPNITIYYLDINKKGNLHYQSNKDLLRYFFKAYRFCKKLKKKKKFNLVHAFFGIPCGYIAMKLRLPYIVSLRGSDVPFYNERFKVLDKLFFKRLSKIIWKKARAVITNSQGLKDLALQVAPKEKISVIYNGVNTEEFFPLSTITSETKQSLKIISTGRLIERKGYKYLIEAISGMDNIQVDLIGDGDLMEELKKLVKEKKANVSFLGKKEHSKLPSYLQRADIFCLPSLNEGMSNSVLEAMACGLPIITTDTGGSKELVKNNGFIVKKENSSEIKEAIKNYLNNPELAKQHGQKSREIAEKMSWGKVAKNYKEVYES